MDSYKIPYGMHMYVMLDRKVVDRLYLSVGQMVCVVSAGSNINFPTIIVLQATM